MPSDLLTCPYCNSPAAAPPGAQPGQRIACTRCGESFSYRGPSAAAAFTPTAPPTPAPAAGPVAAPSRLSNRAIAFIVLSGMAAMAIIGLAYALSTESLRRSYDLRLPKTKAIGIPFYAFLPLALYVVGLIAFWFWGWNRRERSDRATAPPWKRISGLIGLSLLVLIVVELAIVVMHARAPRPAEPEGPPPAHAVPPSELAALGYLPDDTDLIMAIHVAELRDDPVGRDLMRHLGNEDISPRSIQTWTGLPLEAIDHAVLGVTLDENLQLHFTLIVRTRQPVDEDKVRVTLKAEGRRELDGRPVYPFVMQTDLPFIRQLGANLWFADNHTLVVAKVFDDGSAHHLPLAARTGVDHLRPTLRELIKERLSSSTRAWVVGRLPPRETQFPLLRLALGTADNAPLTGVRTFGLWMEVRADEATLRGAFDCEDADAAHALEAYLGPTNRKGLKAWVTPAESGPMGQEFLKSLKITRQETWVDLQATASAEVVHQ
jgi:hypothetical protein